MRNVKAALKQSAGLGCVCVRSWGFAKFGGQGVWGWMQGGVQCWVFSSSCGIVIAFTMGGRRKGEGRKERRKGRRERGREEGRERITTAAVE